VAKAISREQAGRKKAQAAAFMERIGEPDRAREFEAMSVGEYADHRGFQLSNPNRKGNRLMANDITKRDLEDQIDEAVGILSDAYDIESTREDLARAIGSALDVLEGESDDEEDDDDSED